MQCGSNEVWDESGCFVYEVLAETTVRASPSVDVHDRGSSESHRFRVGELVSVDLIRHSRFPRDTDEGKHGPFLRLSDGTGWILERMAGLENPYLRKLEVSIGLWKFYADNPPTGLTLRRHPTDCSINEGNLVKLSPKVVYLPMQCIVCDRKVVARDGTNWYRVQGTSCWTMEYRRSTRQSMMVPLSNVKTGLAAFYVDTDEPVAIRTRCSLQDDCKTRQELYRNDIVVVDAIRYSADADGPGSFVRLTDGSGWLCQCQTGEEPVLRELSIRTGTWHIRITNPVGMLLRSQPVDDYFFHELCPIQRQGTTMLCDRSICSPSGTTFFRKKGTDSWILDKRGDRVLAEIIPTPSDCNDVQHRPSGWTAEFVLTQATRVPELEKAEQTNETGVVSFHNPTSDVGFNVFCGTRAVGISFNCPSKGRTETVRSNCGDTELLDIFRNPFNYTSGEDCQERHSRPQGLIDHTVDESVVPAACSSSILGADACLRAATLDSDEENARKSLMECQAEKRSLESREHNLLRRIKVSEDARNREAKRFHARVRQKSQALEAIARRERQERLEKRQKDIDQQRRELEEEQRRIQERFQQLNEQRKRMEELTCKKCVLEFDSQASLSHHLERVHTVCQGCRKSFVDDQALQQHRKARGH